MNKLVFATRIREAALQIEEGKVDPFLEYKNTRFIIEINRERGMVIWTPFNIDSQTLQGEHSYSYPYAGHSILFEAIFGPRSKSAPQDPIITKWPDYPVAEEDTGSVTP